MKAPTHFIALALLLFLGKMLFAQRNPQPYFRHYGTEHGLPSPEVYCAFEDSRGYMWFGTDNGVARFDGYEFETYDARNGLLSNVVFDIFEDQKGRIWFGTMTGEAYIWEPDTIFSFPYNHLIHKYDGKFGRASLVYLDKDETAYFSLYRFGFLKVDTFGNPDLLLGELPSSNLIVDPDRTKATLYESSNRFDMENFNQFVRDLSERKVFYIDVILDGKRFQKELPRRLSTSFPPCAQRLHSGELLISSHSRINCLVDTQLVWSVPFFQGVNDIVSEEDGTIWFCLTGGNGLRRYADLESLGNDQYDQFLSGLSISNIFADSKGGYWVSTQEKGVYYLFDPDLLTYDSQFGFSTDFVNSLSFLSEEEIYAGLPNGDIFLINIRENQILNKITAPPHYRNFDLYVDERTQTLYSGFSKWEGGKWAHPMYYWRSELGYDKQWVSNVFQSLCPLSEGEILGAHGNGIYLLDKNTHVAKKIMPEENRQRTYFVFPDYTGRIWAGVNRGIFEWQDGILVHPGVAHPAFHSRVEAIDQLPDSTLVFGTKGFGVILWKGDSILQLTKEDGLCSNMLEDIHVDEDGILWAGTLSGLNKISFSEDGQVAIRSFTILNGLPSNEIYQIKSKGGQVWLCTSKGLVRFRERPEESFSARPIFQSSTANGKPIDFSRVSSFSHTENNLEFKFLAINYRMNGRIPYRYRLDADAPWQYTQNLSVNYPQLPPGDYAFEVQAQNEDGYWSESSVFDFSILPPWWASSWFRILGFLAFTLTGFAIYKYRINQLRKENALQRQVAELEKAALQAQMSPHFIFNALNSIQNFILQNDKKKAVEYLSRFAKLVRHNLNASVNGEVSLEEEIGLLDNYMALEQERFEHGFDYRIEMADGLDKQLIEFPPMLIQPYVENAIIHGLAKKEEKGKVNVHFSLHDSDLLVKVRDNGSGFGTNGDGKKKGTHKSVGMHITRKRLELLDANSQDLVIIKTLKNEQNAPEGTEVTIRIRIKKTKS